MEEQSQPQSWFFHFFLRCQHVSIRPKWQMRYQNKFHTVNKRSVFATGELANWRISKHMNKRE